MNKISNYLLLLASALYCFILHLFITLLNSTLAQIGIYCLIPSLFLFTPPLLSKNFSLVLIIFNGFMLDYHHQLPLGFNVFLLVGYHLLIQGNFKLNINYESSISRTLPILINVSFFFCLYFFTQFQIFSSNEWNLSRFFTDLLVSIIMLFFFLRPHLQILQILTTKSHSLPIDKSLVKE